MPYKKNLNPPHSHRSDENPSPSPANKPIDGPFGRARPVWIPAPYQRRTRSPAHCRTPIERTPTLRAGALISASGSTPPHPTNPRKVPGHTTRMTCVGRRAPGATTGRRGGRSACFAAWSAMCAEDCRTTGVIGPMRGTIESSRLRCTCTSQSKS